ncbi:MAG: hypothetical protein WAJ93_01390 [Candidatus Nitrosopolaris sp.]
MARSSRKVSVSPQATTCTKAGQDRTIANTYDDTIPHATVPYLPYIAP